MNYVEWEMGVPSVITSDSIWKMRAYRLALFVSDIGWQDVTHLGADNRTAKVAGQLYRSLGSIGANLAEGYSYGTGANRARVYECALGSARESKEWYYRGRFIISEKVSFHRMSLLEEIIKLILTMIPDQRGCTLRDSNDITSYVVENSNEPSEQLLALLCDVPLVQS